MAGPPDGIKAESDRRVEALRRAVDDAVQQLRAAAMFTLIETAKLNDVDPQAWLADVLRRINGYPAIRLSDLLPWGWRESPADTAAAA